MLRSGRILGHQRIDTDVKGTGMINRYRFTVADGTPQWSKGWRAYKEMYAHVWDRLRFHRGAGFKIDGRPQVLKLVNVEDELKGILDNQAPGKLHTVDALSDGYTVKVERFQTEDLHGQDVLDHLRNAIGTPYMLGGATLGGMDCSGSTLWAHAFEGVTLPHNAAQQHDMFRNQAPGFHIITREQILPGDLVFFHNDDHVAPYAGHQWGYDVVIDEEPHNTGSPSGWPSSYLGVGLRVRPMTGTYYCSWAYSNGIGRIEAINGRP